MATMVLVLTGMYWMVTKDSRKRAEMVGYTTRMIQLESKQQDQGFLDAMDQAEFAELKMRVGRMKADGNR